MLTRNNWTTRCAARLMAAGGCKDYEAAHLARELAEAMVRINGASGMCWPAPEDVADEEVAQWEDDEE